MHGHAQLRRVSDGTRLVDATVSSLLPHTGASWQAVADEIRAANSNVLVQIVPCDLGRPAGVATLCAAAQRRDVTLAVASI